MPLNDREQPHQQDLVGQRGRRDQPDGNQWGSVVPVARVHAGRRSASGLVLACQWNETHRQKRPRCHLAIHRLGDQGELLHLELRPHRYQHDPPRL